MSEQETGAAAEREVDAVQTVEQVIRHRVSDVLGGWYGSLETALPTVAFVVLWLIRDEVRPALYAAAAVAIILLGIRLYIGGSVRFVLTSLFATAIAAFFALRSGQAEDAFLPGIITSAAYGVAMVVSIVTRWPAVGFIVAAGDPQFAERPTAWHRDSALVRVCSRLTWVLVVLFAVRVGLMLPLYLAGEVAWLGVAKIALGWPAYLVAIVVMGLMLATGRTPVQETTE
ncbi:DUF3159 domain-containing protein [Ornithinimicrobium sp. F0845]|uniref:DUF3159 domain-containing protein n=1 Tax=Ornithinimicrobium sp. F0845 TaxID=2926412 RepID=UPI001FF4C9CB|nr:DUF3159 domain-containing protein [Ornithinimicrobium sp. F0845]MCK0111776.1 DUF3159 domain-containing protein [Ornithinimicrobium sp. F0845]